MRRLRIDLSGSPTITRLVKSDASVTGIRGPFGSGKSVGCSTWLMRQASIQPPGRDNIRHSRWAVIRNTTPELRSTTIKTLTSQFPEGPHGRVTYTSPITYGVRFPERGLNNPGLDAEVMFLALDRPADVRKLLSLEVTGAWVNEAREVQKPVIDALMGRTARYPSGDLGETSKPIMVADTNSPDTSHWWGEWFDAPREIRVTVEGREYDLSWRGLVQPPAVLELEQRAADDFRSVEPGFPYSYTRKEVIEAADRFWGVNPEAENLSNLNAVYYHSLIVNKSIDFIRVYAQGKYGYVQDGRPCVPEFNPEFQVREFPVLPDQKLMIGIDIGGGTLMPAAAIVQKHPLGAWLCHDEVWAESMGVDRFATLLRDHVLQKYPGMAVEVVYTDPAAETKDEIFEVQVNAHLRARGFPVRPAPSNRWEMRRLAIAQPCSRVVMGKPGLMIHPRCRRIVDGLKGKWAFRQLRVSGSTPQYAAIPDKNEYSHPCEALGYVLLGGGERHVSKVVSGDAAGSSAEQKWRHGWDAEDFPVFGRASLLSRLCSLWSEPTFTPV